MDLSLTPELERLVTERVQSGRYASAIDVIAEALRLLEEHEQAVLDALRADIAEGIASIERGEGISGDEVFARLRARRAMRRQ